MNDALRIELGLRRALEAAKGPGTPPRLLRALEHTLFPGGARLRPALTVAVAQACGDDDPELVTAAAAAVELIHCASLAHDDLPMFDDADLRRGRPTVHRAYGEPLALLSGDGLIVLAFQVLAGAESRHPERIPALVAALAEGAGTARGIVAGQAWESEPVVDVESYHRAKTGALFEAAAALGAIAAGEDPAAWRRVGSLIGMAYQVADDLYDSADSADLGGREDKVRGRDRALGRPSAVEDLGPAEAAGRLRRLVAAAWDAIPDARGRTPVERWIAAVGTRLGLVGADAEEGTLGEAKVALDAAGPVARTV